MDICLRVLKESSKSRFDSYSVRNSIYQYSIRNSVLNISHITFWDCRVHIFSDNLSRNSCKNAPVISGKVYVAWKRKMLHDVGLHDVIGGHQAYIHRKRLIHLWRIEFCIWLRPRAVHVIHVRAKRV